MSAYEPNPPKKRSTIIKSDKAQFLDWLRANRGFTITPYLIFKAEQEL